MESHLEADTERYIMITPFSDADRALQIEERDHLMLEQGFAYTSPIFLYLYFA